MMKRRWSNNGGFTALRMLDESSSEVTSSSAALVMSPGMTMSPTSLGSPEYNELEQLWGGYDENAYNGHSVLSNGNNALGGGGGCGGVAANQLLMNGIMNGGQNGLNGMMNGIGIGPGVAVGPHGPNQASSNQIQQFVGNLISGMNHSQTIIPPLPSIIQNTIMNTPRSESVNSISSGKSGTTGTQSVPLSQSPLNHCNNSPTSPASVVDLKITSASWGKTPHRVVIRRLLLSLT
ncbi:hypothetical protein ZHAS_00017882 [Anopheles sinensis]|uniref:Uncharacterized protein n=1 Tax=Anopheles sinensis TaxID=74873 RepID=A0A084WHH8_ANOSI|nr:hypothetical protein ZHAS_00017882 [Anopheles sinensis]